MADAPRRSQQATETYDYPDSFAARPEAFSKIHPPNTTISGTTSSSRYKDGMTIRAVTPEPEDLTLPGVRPSSGPSRATHHEGDKGMLQEPMFMFGESPMLGDLAATPPRTPSNSTVISASKYEPLRSHSPDPFPIRLQDSKPKGLMNRASMTLAMAAQFAEFNIGRARNRSPGDKLRNRSGNGSNAVASLEDLRSRMAECEIKPAEMSRTRTAPAEMMDMPFSVGYPSTQAIPVMVPPPTAKSNRSSRSRMLRPQSSIGALTLTRSADRDDTFPHITNDYGILLHLMKTLRGQMEGYVDFRIGSSPIWTKGYCSIDLESGALMYQKIKQSSEPLNTILPDLRGCQASIDTEEDGIINIITHGFKIIMKLRPLNVQQYEHWLAALLCWQPIRPAGVKNKMVRIQTKIFERSNKRSNSVSIIKVGNMRLWIPERPDCASCGSSNNSIPTLKSNKPKHPTTWQNVSCTLHDTGEFRLHREDDAYLIASISLNELSRCAVQQLDPSILCEDFCIAIYPQYTARNGCSSARPLYLALGESSGGNSRLAFEVWFVLLRAFTMPEIYGPALPKTLLPLMPEESRSHLADSYRVHRSLFMRVIEAKLKAGNDRENADCYAEVLLDGEVRAKTMVRTKTANPFWREEYEFLDLPTCLTDAAVVLKQRDPRSKNKGPQPDAGTHTHGPSGCSTVLPGSRDLIIGSVDLKLDELTGSKTTMEGWMGLKAQIKEGVYEHVGEVYIKAEMQEIIVLMSSEYEDLSTLLHDFENGLSHKLGTVVTDLKKLATTLLQIFQVSGKATSWIMSLAEAEIAELNKPKNRASTNFTDANILFRGNSLLTKALDTHMRRVGHEYLEETLGPHLRQIAVDDVHCEVDPMKLESNDNVARNWKTLIAITRSIWGTIYKSPHKCPLELRKIFSHIRKCVKDRYEQTFSQVSYSSVCGFLFLRFFCPAILNPKLFGLMKDHPGARAQRTLTLVAKSLQGFANMTTFGVKEPWMAPMNSFLSEHTVELCSFVDAIADLPDPLPATALPPSYATPTTIRSRLCPSSREGFPSLPYLIDDTRAYAALVMLWGKYRSLSSPEIEPGDPVAEFSRICERIEGRVKECVAKAEAAERPGTGCSERWEEVAESVTGGVVKEGVYRRDERARKGQSVMFGWKRKGKHGHE